MTLGNPALRRMAKKADGGAYSAAGATATYKGVYGKAALYALTTIICAVAVEFGLLAMFKAGNYEGVLNLSLIIMGVSFVPLFAVALIIAFVPSTVKVLGFFYAAFQGLSLGLVSLCVDQIYPGMAFGALLGTLIVFFVALFVNHVFKVKISSKLILGLMVAFVSLAFVQLIMCLLSLVGVFNLFVYKAYFWIEFAISALCIIWATLMIFFDLQNIDYIVGTCADKKYEWYAAFSLVSTLIYLYVEILELLLRLAVIFGKSRN